MALLDVTAGIVAVPSIQASLQVRLAMACAMVFLTAVRYHGVDAAVAYHGGRY